MLRTVTKISLPITNLSHIRVSCRTMHLLNEKAFVNGEWKAASSERTFNVLNPATGKIVGNVPDMDVNDVEQAIIAAEDAFRTWQSKTGKERSSILKRWHQLLEVEADGIAKIMTAESGKPLAEARGEVAYGNSFVEWFAEEARRIDGEIISSPFVNRKMFVERQPIGVVGLITPWNFPHAMITRKAGAALAAGCTCVVKPAEDTPLTALALSRLALEAGIPNGVFNVVTCSRENAAEVGKLFCNSKLIAGISFTGSTQVGKLLYKQCSSTVKRIGLELGGNAPFIVFNSANIDKAVDGAMASKFRNCGQTCVSANRFLIQDGIYDEFIGKLLERIRNVNIGDGMTSGVTIGPLINESQHAKVSGMVEDARNKGAKVLTGGKSISSLGKLFYEPTLIADVKESMQIYKEEVFGPVVTVIPFKTEEEALNIANDTDRGLAGYFYSENVSQIFRVARNLQVGMIGINEGIISTAEAPFGGIKESGIGREGSHHGIDDYVYLKYLCIGNL